MNVLGYDRKSLMEDSIDPNHYFPYKLMDQTLCMQTIAGRTVNEIFRDHSFQLRFTFHGDMEAIFGVFFCRCQIFLFSDTLEMYSLSSL